MENEGWVGGEYGGAGVERGIGNRGNFKLGYVNIQGVLKKKLDLVADGMEEKGISVMGLGETNMKKEGIGVSVEGLEWVGQGTQQRVWGVGLLVREGLIYRTFKGDREGWLPIEILVDGKCVVTVVVYLWQRANKCLDARQENDSILREIGNFIGMRAKQGKGVVIMRDFNARIGEVVGDERGSRNREWRALIKWIESMDIWVVNGSLVAKGRWTWMNGQRRSIIDYILIGGALGGIDILQMRVGDTGVLKYQRTIN